MASIKSDRKETASQTAGPFVHIGLAPAVAGLAGKDNGLGAEIAAPGVAGRRISVTGTVRDGAGALVTDVLIEVWQCDASGRYHATPTADGFRGWGRAVTDFDSGTYTIDTIKPGPVTSTKGPPMAPHLNLWLVARGINIGLHTKVYFDDEDSANLNDPVLRAIDPPERRETLLARARSDGHYAFDIVLQGDKETVFFDL